MLYRTSSGKENFSKNLIESWVATRFPRLFDLCLLLPSLVSPNASRVEFFLSFQEACEKRDDVLIFYSATDKLKKAHAKLATP